MSSVVSLQPNGSRTPFFWVHGERSNALLPDLLGPDQPLFGVLHQSHDGRRAQFSRMEEIAAHYLESVRRIQPTGPYRLGGFCVGATLAFEMARQLHERGERVDLLAMLDPPVTGPDASPLARIPRGQSVPAPFAPTAPSTLTFWNWFTRQFRQVARMSPREAGSYVRNGFLNRSAELQSRIERAAWRLRRARPPAEPPEQIMRPERRNRYIGAVHYRAKLGYLPQRYGGKVSILKTEGGCRDPESVWGPLAGAGMEVIELPGRHTEITEDAEQIKGLANHLRALLEAAG